MKWIICSVGVTLLFGASCSDDNGTGPDKGIDSTITDGRQKEAAAPEAAVPDKGPSTKCGCKVDEICVRWFRSTCESMGQKCVKLPSSCTGNPCTSCPEEVCGGPDGGISWSCDGTAPCPTPDSGVPWEFDHACYGP